MKGLLLLEPGLFLEALFGSVVLSCLMLALIKAHTGYLHLCNAYLRWTFPL